MEQTSHSFFSWSQIKTPTKHVLCRWRFSFLPAMLSWTWVFSSWKVLPLVSPLVKFATHPRGFTSGKTFQEEKSRSPDASGTSRKKNSAFHILTKHPFMSQFSFYQIVFVASSWDAIQKLRAQMMFYVFKKNPTESCCWPISAWLFQFDHKYL